MSVVGDGLNLVKTSKEWKEEFQKKHDKDLYIHRLEDLNEKLCKENNMLREENKKLKEQENDLIFDNGFYWKENAEKHRDGPFCSNCWDGEHKLIRIQNDRVNPNTYYECPRCKFVSKKNSSTQSSAFFISTHQENSPFPNHFGV